MKAIKFSLLAGALLASTGIAAAQSGQGHAGPSEITREQAVARAEQRFARLDANRDGQLTVEEARQGRNPARAQQREARRAQRQAQRAERRAQRAAMRLQRFDTNRDGQLSEEERAKARAQRAERRAQRGQRQAQRSQRRAERGFGQDGVITLAEFRSRALRRFERFDANRDGLVTPAERQEVRQRMRSERQQRRQNRD